jgi:hypothetical protein
MPSDEEGRACCFALSVCQSTSSFRSFLARLHKLHPAYRMVNGWRAGAFNRVLTLCNQLLPHLLADILQTLHSCYGHIENVHVTFWKYSDIFFEKFTCSWTWSFFQHVLNRRHLLYVINSSHTFRLTYSSNLVQLLWTHWRCACDFLEDYRHYLKNLHVVELNHFSSMFWINCIYCHQLITVTIMDKCLRATRPFLFLNRFSALWLHILKWNLVCRFLIWISRPSCVLGTREQFLTELCPLDFWKIPIICSVCSFSMQRLHILK